MAESLNSMYHIDTCFVFTICITLTILSPGAFIITACAFLLLAFKDIRNLHIAEIFASFIRRTNAILHITAGFIATCARAS